MSTAQTGTSNVQISLNDAPMQYPDNAEPVVSFIESILYMYEYSNIVFLLYMFI